MESKDGISDCSECLEILELLLDKEATRKQEVYFKNHIEGCLQCFNNFELERQIKELIRTRMSNMPVPEGLASQIRTKIQSYTD